MFIFATRVQSLTPYFQDKYRKKTEWNMISLKNDRLSQLLLSGMRSLWGVITPNIRKVSIDQKNDVISIYFYYDNDPSDTEIELSEDAATEVISDFTDPFLINCIRQTINSQKKIDVQGNLIYSRYETC